MIAEGYDVSSGTVDGTTTRPIRIALVGDRFSHLLAHRRIPVAPRNATAAADAVAPSWIASPDVARTPGLADFDGSWLVPGSPYADREGALAAVTVARTHGVPFRAFAAATSERSLVGGP